MVFQSASFDTLCKPSLKGQQTSKTPEVSRRLSLPKSSTHCLLLTLERRGYLIRDARTRRYAFGLKLLLLAKMTPNGMKLREEAVPCLRALSEQAHTTVHMAVLDQPKAMIIEKVEPPGVRPQSSWVGKRLELHWRKADRGQDCRKSFRL